eukprot:1140643-Pelagomonas_calceolata.AAC.2
METYGDYGPERRSSQPHFLRKHLGTSKAMPRMVDYKMSLDRIIFKSVQAPFIRPARFSPSIAPHLQTQTHQQLLGNAMVDPGDGPGI